MKREHQKILKCKIFLTIFLNILIGCSSSEKVAGSSSEKNEYILLRGLNYSQNGNFIEAEKEFLKILKSDEKDLILLEEFAFVKLKLGEKEEAVKLYKEILKKSSKNINVIKNLAYIYLESSNYEKSMEHLNKIPVSMRDEEVELLFEENFYRSENWKNLEISLEKKTGIKKEYDEELDNRYVKSLLKQNKNDKLYFYLTEKYRYNSSNEKFLIFKTKILEEKYGEYEQSRRVIQRYIANYSYSDEILFSLGENYLKEKKYEEIERILKLVSLSSIYDSRYLKLKEVIEAFKL